MNSPANDTFYPTHSSVSNSDCNLDIFGVDRSLARSPNATILVDTKLLATPVTFRSVSTLLVTSYFLKLFNVFFQRRWSVVVDLTKYLFSLDSEGSLVYLILPTYKKIPLFNTVAGKV